MKACLFKGIFSPIVRNKDTTPNLSLIGVWARNQLGFIGFSLGDERSGLVMPPRRRWARLGLKLGTGPSASAQLQAKRENGRGGWLGWGLSFGPKPTKEIGKLSINFQPFIDGKFIWIQNKFKFSNDSYPWDKIQGHFITKKNMLWHECNK
jgi:hypothetical protein